MLTNYWKIPKAECPDIWIRLPRHKWPKSWSSMEDAVVPLARILYGHLFGRTIMGKAIWENPIKTWMGENSKLGMSLCSSWKRIILICVCGWHKIGVKKQRWSDVESTQQRSQFGRTNIFFDRVFFGCTQRQCEISEDIVDNHRTMFDSRISAERTEKLPYSENLRTSSWSYDMEGHQRNLLSDNVSEQKTQLNNSTKCLLPASMTTTTKKSKWNLLKNCHKYALKLFWNVYTWHVLDDLIFYGQWISLHDPSRSGPMHVTNAWIDWFLTFITRVNTNTSVLWVTLPSNADWDCFNTLILREISRIQNPLLQEHCAFLEVRHLFQKFGFARNKLQFHTVPQNPKSSLWTLDWD